MRNPPGLWETQSSTTNPLAPRSRSRALIRLVPISWRNALSPVEIVSPNRHPHSGLSCIFPSARTLVLEGLSLHAASRSSYLWGMNEEPRGMRRGQRVSELAQAEIFLSSDDKRSTGRGRGQAAIG